MEISGQERGFNKRDAETKKKQKQEIERLRDTLINLRLDTDNAIDQLERLTMPKQSKKDKDPKQEESMIEEGCKVKILPRKNEPWKTAHYVGMTATVIKVTSEFVSLKIHQGTRKEALRRKKKYVQIVE